MQVLRSFYIKTDLSVGNSPGLTRTSRIAPEIMKINFDLHYILASFMIFISMEFKKHINIRITHDQFIQLMKTVEKEETNLSELIRKMIDRNEKLPEKRKTKKVGGNECHSHQN